MIQGDQPVIEQIEPVAQGIALRSLGFAVELVDRAEHAEDEEVLAPVFGRASDRLDRGSSEGNADVDDAALFLDLLDLVGVVKTDAAVPQ